MTIEISIKTDKFHDKQKHGNVFPDLRSSPVDNIGQADDQRLASMFASDTDSFFNRTNNDILNVSIAMLSGTDHYNLNSENDLLSADQVDPAISRLQDELDTLSGIPNDQLSAADQAQIVFLQRKINSINQKVLSQEELATAGFPDANIDEANNFNPDFGADSISWRYAPSASPSRASVQDNVTNASKHPNLSYPFNIVNNDGTINYNKNESFVTDITATNNFGSNDTGANRSKPDIVTVLSKYN